MDNCDIQSLIKNIHLDSSVVLEKLELIIGKDTNLLPEIVSQLVQTKPTSTSYLNLCYLLLLEKQDSIVDVIRNILQHNPEEIYAYVMKLLNSKYYYHRLAVPRIIVNLEFAELPLVLKQCLGDDIGLVVNEAAISLDKYKTIPLSDSELVEIAMDLNNHQYEYVQCCVSDILVHIKQRTFLISDVCLSKSWRRRLSIAKKIDLFDMEDRVNIFNILSNDNEESIREVLVSKIDSLENFRTYVDKFIKDSSSKVRSMVVKKIGNLSEYRDILKDVSSDSSWNVRRELLCIHNEEIYENISLPLMASLPKNFEWRVKIEILEAFYHISLKNEVLLQKYLVDTLFSYLNDKVAEVRTKAADILENIIIRCDWSIEWKEKIESLISSENYLIRYNVCKSCLSFDKKFNTSFVERLLNDKIFNVKMKMIHVLEKEDLSDSITSSLEELLAFYTDKESESKLPEGCHEVNDREYIICEINRLLGKSDPICNKD